MAAAPRPVTLLEQACRGSRRNPLQYEQSPVPGRPVVAVTTSAQGGLFVIRAHAPRRDPIKARGNKDASTHRVARVRQRQNCRYTMPVTKLLGLRTC